MRLSQVRKYKVDLLIFLLYFILSFNIAPDSFTTNLSLLLTVVGRVFRFFTSRTLPSHILWKLLTRVNYRWVFLFFFFFLSYPLSMRTYLRYTRLSPNNPPTESAHKTCCQSLWEPASSSMLSMSPFTLFLHTFTCTLHFQC